MKITDLLIKLQAVKKLHGNLPIVGGTLMDDTPLKEVVVVDSEGRDADEYKTKAIGVFLTQ